MSSGHGRATGSLPIGVMLAADGAVRGNAVGTLTPPGGVRFPSAWEQESAPPLPRREPQAAPRSGFHEPEVRSLPRRRELRDPQVHSGQQVHGGPQVHSGQQVHSGRDNGPRSPRTHPMNRPQFPPTLPPGVVRLDEPDPAGHDGAPQPPVALAEEPRAGRGRPERRLPADDAQATRIIGRSPRRPGGPATGSLDVDAELFTPASERLARQTPSGGIAARHTPSAGLPLSHLQVLSGPAPAAAGGSAPAAYPRRRDLRRQGGAAAFVPVPSPTTAASTPP